MKYSITSRPDDIPSQPQQVYKNQGYKNLGDWLGTGNVSVLEIRKNYLTFIEARKFARRLNFTSAKEWKEYCQSGNKPANIPSDPKRVYKDKGFINLKDFIGYEYINNTERNFCSYKKAQKFASKLNISSESMWREYKKNNKLPLDIPASPERIYKNKGWKDYGSFFGYQARPRKGNWRSFQEAKKFVRSLNIKTEKEWREYCKSGKKPKDIPSKLAVYKKDGYLGIGDFLGTGKIADQYKIYRPFEEARKYARNLRLKNVKGWIDNKEKLPNDIPKNPDRTYKNSGWKGFGDFLGTGNVANNLKKYKKFKEAQKFALSLDITSRKQWFEYTKNNMLPQDIPAGPERVYEKKGWKGYHHFLTGNEFLATQKTKFRSYSSAKKYVHTLNLKTFREWQKFASSNLRPKDIPSSPDITYKNKGWVNVNDWLGTKK